MMKKSIHKILFIAVFIVFLIVLIPLVLFTPTHVVSEMSVETETTVNESKVCCMSIQLEEGITELEVKNILENCNLTIYRLEDDTDDMADKYYIKVENNKNITVRDELKSASDIKKGDYYIIYLSEQAIKNKSFLEMLDKNDIQLKKFVCYRLYFGEGSKNWIPERDAIRIKSELEMNEKVLNVFPEYLEG